MLSIADVSFAIVGQVFSSEIVAEQKMKTGTIWFTGTNEGSKPKEKRETGRQSVPFRTCRVPGYLFAAQDHLCVHLLVTKFC
jgi:hypothetical protein